MFFSICLGRKNSEATALVGILKKKNAFPRIKTFIFLFKKRNKMGCLIKNNFCFHMTFKHDFMTQII